jgi:hypothetical protein
MLMIGISERKELDMPQKKTTCPAIGRIVRLTDDDPDYGPAVLGTVAGPVCEFGGVEFVDVEIVTGIRGAGPTMLFPVGSVEAL